MYKVGEGYEMATNVNLPSLSAYGHSRYVNERLRRNLLEISLSEFKKSLASSRENYSDENFRYVQIKRSIHIDYTSVMIWTVVIAKHEIGTPMYNVCVNLKDGEDQVVAAECEGCSEDNCEHVMAFLAWLNRRTEEPPTTEVISYCN